MKLFCLRLAHYFILAGMLFLAGCNLHPEAGEKDSQKPGEETKAKEPEAVPVEVATLERGPLEETLKLSTTLETEAKVKVLSRSANRVTELLVEEGDRVEETQVLVRLENEIQRIAVAQASNNLDKARAEFERQKPLYEQNLISEQVFTDLKFEMRNWELQLQDAQRQLDDTEVRAPIAGTVTVRLVNLGDYVTINQHLFDLVDFDSLVARVYHPEKFLTRLSLNQPARVRATALGDQVFPAYVRRISPVVEGQTGTVKVTLGFEDVGPLRPGMHVETELVLATLSNALLIPKRALVYDGDQTFVYRLKPERKVERLLVEARLSDKLHITPRSGFAEGDQIVVAGQTGLKDGASVRLPEDPVPDEPGSDTNFVQEAKRSGTGS